MKYILILIGAAVIILLFVYYIYRECTLVTVSEYEFSDPRLKKDSYCLVMLSDLHETRHKNDNEEVMRLIDRIAPDGVFFAGDMITAGNDHPLDYSVTLSLIKRIAEKYPIYYGIGNHEEKLKRYPSKGLENWDYYTGELSRFNVSILQNERVLIEEAGIMVYGLDLEYEYFRKIWDKPVEDGHLKELIGERDGRYYSILLAHFPDQFEAYVKWGAELILSGHVHGGVINVPFLGGLVSPQLKLFPKYDAGEFKKGASTMIVSRGIGTHTVPLRINNRAEVVKIVLKRET